MALFRRIAFKLSLVFVIIGLVPMVTVSVFAYLKARDSMTKSGVEFFVARVARDTAERVNFMVERMKSESTFFARSPYLIGLLDEYHANRGTPDVQRAMLTAMQDELNHAVATLDYVDMFLITDVNGIVIMTSSFARPSRTGRVASENAPSQRYLWSNGTTANPLAGTSINDRTWFKNLGDGSLHFIDCDYDPLIQQTYGYGIYADEKVDRPGGERTKNPEAFSFGYALGIPAELGAAGSSEVAPPSQAILVAIYNWSAVQDILDQVNDEFVRLHPLYKSGYTFLFRDDMNTIIGHKYKENYLTRLIEDHELRELHDKIVAAGNQDTTCEYFYRSEKISGISKVSNTGWRLGFGINKSDIFVEVKALRSWMFFGAMALSGVILILVAFASRRITEPIRRLTEGTLEISRGNLDARVVLDADDEIAVLGDAFNKMAEDLKISNKRLIEAQKTAAWQEMARQVAHEIKNPLTPMKLNAQLIKRAHADHHPDFEKILVESVEGIVAQIESLRRIASNFAGYAAFPQSDKKPCSIKKLVDDCVRLYSNQPASGIEVTHECFVGDDVYVMADADEIGRVFLNLFNNAFEAMSEGGSLTVTTMKLEHPERGEVVRISIKDTGRGIPPDVMQHLFEPYFTTRSSGTGLGLAITKKIVTGHDGTITIESALGSGTTIVIHLPVSAASPEENHHSSQP